MVEVYYYLPVNEVDTSIECGIKLSELFDKEVVIDGDKRKCLSGLLNPKDDIKKYASKDVECVKLEVQSKYCFIAEKSLYHVGLRFPEAMEMYKRSLIPVDKYIFGAYRQPECLVTSTVISGHISLLNRTLDSPVLFESSEQLYTDNIIESYREENNCINDALLYCFYSKLAEIKKFDKIEDNENKVAVFKDNSGDKIFVIRIPDMYDCI